MMASRLQSLFPLLLLLSTLTMSAKGEDVIVTFVLLQKINVGKVFKIVGNDTALGNWTPGQVEAMTWTPCNAWASSVVLTKGVAYSFKAVGVAYENQSDEPCWMPGNNRELEVPETYFKKFYVEALFWNESCGIACSCNSVCNGISKLSKSGHVPQRIRTVLG